MQHKMSHCLYCLREIPFLLNGKPWLFCSPDHNPVYTYDYWFNGKVVLKQKASDILNLVAKYHSELDMPNQSGRYFLAPETYRILYKKAFNFIGNVFIIEKRYTILREKLMAEHDEKLLDTHLKVINLVLEQLRELLTEIRTETWLKAEDSQINLPIDDEYLQLPSNSVDVYTSLNEELWNKEVFSTSPIPDLLPDSGSESESESESESGSRYEPEIDEEEEEALMKVELERYRKENDSEETEGDESQRREEDEDEDEFNMIWPESKAGNSFI